MAHRKPTTDFQQEAPKRILAALLADFRERNLTAQDLHRTYQGISPDGIKQVCCADGEISEVDFDLAFQNLEQDDLIDTGPKEHVLNDPNSGVLMIGFFTSKREYTFLSEEGYKAATRVRPLRPHLNQHLHFSGTFHQSPIGVGDHVIQTLNISSKDAELFDQLRREIPLQIAEPERKELALQRLAELEKAPDKPSRMDRYLQFVGALGDHITVFSPVLTLLMRSFLS